MSAPSPGRFSHAYGARATRPGDGADVSASGDHGFVSGRVALEAGADRADDRGLAGSSGMDEGVETVSEGAVDEFYQSGCGSAGLRVSSESIFDCGGVGRDLGEQPGIADACVEAVMEAVAVS